MKKALIIGAAVAGFTAAGLVLVVWTWVKGPDRADANDRQLVTLGNRVYADNCAECHGKQLEGEPNWRVKKEDGTLPAPPHDASGHTWHHPDRLLFDITKRGGQAVAPPDFKSNMPAFDEVLSDREIWAVLSYIKSRWPREVRWRQEGLNQRDG